jgi:hypothetical protein
MEGLVLFSREKLSTEKRSSDQSQEPTVWAGASQEGELR